MMSALKEWIMGITCVSVLLAAAQCLMPEGTVRKIGNLAGGLLLLLGLAAPITKLDMEGLSLALTKYRVMETDSAALLELENTRLLKKVIEEQTAAYILDKAAEIGVECTAEVSYEYSDTGEAYPVAVTIWGDLTDEEERKLSRIIESDLAILRENQIYEKGNVQ